VGTCGEKQIPFEDDRKKGKSNGNGKNKSNGKSFDAKFAKEERKVRGGGAGMEVGGGG
jgi:hypothetical protein